MVSAVHSTTQLYLQAHKSSSLYSVTFYSAFCSQAFKTWKILTVQRPPKMRLLHTKRLEFAEFHDSDKRPRYVIASHRWYEESEVTFQDVQNRRETDKDGCKKFEAFARYVRIQVLFVEWLWIDTCCINETNAAELSEAINLMLKWYHNAGVCLAYLADVEGVRQRAEFAQTITNLFEPVFHDYDVSRGVSIDEKLKRMEGRSTTRPEDLSYARCGICRVTPGANYGEGYEGARQRLLAAMNYQENLIAQQAEGFRQIGDWMSPSDSWTDHRTARSLHEPKTGMWLLESNQYQRWKSAATRHLWMYGKAGCRKTVLCSTAIEDMKDHCQPSSNAAYAVFYFSFSDDMKQRLVDLLRSLASQLG
nr:vegetative incompatibility protein het-e-1 [Quercus suber]